MINNMLLINKAIHHPDQLEKRWHVMRVGGKLSAVPNGRQITSCIHKRHFVLRKPGFSDIEVRNL